jgi:integrin-linked kinase-associated serine/threonine phosphatase 2C
MTMEDTHVALDDLGGKYGLSKDQTRAFYAVYDGHGGRNAAEVAKTALHEAIFKDPSFGQGADEAKVMEAVMNGFKKTDEVILKKSKAEQWNDGATAVCALFVGPKLYVANLGDAELVLPSRTASGLSVACISQKHKPSSPRERQRVEQAGGHVIFGRILGSLAVSRSFGDTEFKYPQNRGSGDFVSCIPHITTVSLTPNNHFVILACDGLWDKMSYEEAVALCDEFKTAGKSPTEAAQLLVKKALYNGTLDNVNCIVVYLHW